MRVPFWKGSGLTLIQTIDVLLLKIGVGMGIFRALVESSKPLGLQELAAVSGADEVLQAQIMRGLTTINAVDEADVERYIPNKVTRAFTTVKGESGLDLL